MKRPQFSLKTLVFVVTVAAVLLGWWADHRRLTQKIEELETPKLFELEPPELFLRSTPEVPKAPT